MSDRNLCLDCKNLLANQNSPKHERLEERSRINNYTIYRCQHCSAVLEQTALPCSWQLLPIPFKASSQRF